MSYRRASESRPDPGRLRGRRQGASGAITGQTRKAAGAGLYLARGQRGIGYGKRHTIGDIDVGADRVAAVAALAGIPSSASIATLAAVAAIAARAGSSPIAARGPGTTPASKVSYRPRAPPPPLPPSPPVTSQLVMAPPVMTTSPCST